MVNVFLISIDKLDELKTQLNQYFVHLGKNQTVFHVFVQVLCINVGIDNDKGTTMYHHEMFNDVDNVISLFSKWLKIISYIIGLVKSANAQIVGRDLDLVESLVVLSYLM